MFASPTSLTFLFEAQNGKGDSEFIPVHVRFNRDADIASASSNAFKQRIISVARMLCSDSYRVDTDGFATLSRPSSWSVHVCVNGKDSESEDWFLVADNLSSGWQDQNIPDARTISSRDITVCVLSPHPEISIQVGFISKEIQSKHAAHGFLNVVIDFETICEFKHAHVVLDDLLTVNLLRQKKLTCDVEVMIYD
jgi:hypothetical protein